MNDRVGQAQRLGQRLDAGWRPGDVEAQLAALHARRRRTRTQRRVLVPIACFALAGAIAAIVWNVRSDEAIVRPEIAIVPAPEPRTPPAPVPPSDRSVEPARESAVRQGTAGNAHTREVPVLRDAIVHNQPDSLHTWRDDAERGDYAAAWAALGRQTASLDRMEDLLLAGDVARLSGHAEAAVAPLGRAIALHPKDPRAQLAAFSLGRVYLESLGAPRDAAIAFAHARELAPDGPLAEDALAREVEAWSRAGETETARQRALVYVERYPDGRRARAVRKFGGLEGP